MWKILVLFAIVFVLLLSVFHFQVIVCNFVAFLADFVVQSRSTFFYPVFHFCWWGGGGFMICYVAPQPDCQYFLFVWGSLKEKPFFVMRPFGHLNLPNCFTGSFWKSQIDCLGCFRAQMICLSHGDFAFLTDPKSHFIPKQTPFPNNPLPAFQGFGGTCADDFAVCASLLRVICILLFC